MAEEQVQEGEVTTAVLDLCAICDGMVKDARNFDKGVQAPAVRIRKGLQKIKVDSHELRARITKIRSERAEDK
jgi:hypothetical protein